MELTDEEKVFVISLLSNKLTYLERDYLQNQKRLKNIFNDSGDNQRFESSLVVQKHKIDLCLDIMEKLR